MATIKGIKLKQNNSTILEMDEVVIPFENLFQFIRDISNITQNEIKMDIVNETCFMEKEKNNLTRTEYNKSYYAKHKNDPVWRAKQKASREKSIQKKKSNQSLEQNKK